MKGFPGHPFPLYPRPTPEADLDFLYISLSTLGALLLLAGFVGCVLPVLPGPPLSFVAILLIFGAQGWQAETFGVTTVIVLGGAAVLVTILDFVTPLWGAKKYGASRMGIVGSIAGMIAGAIFFPPSGLILVAFVGALAGELIEGKQGSEATRAAWGVFIGTVIGILLKLGVCVAITVYWVREILA